MSKLLILLAICSLTPVVYSSENPSVECNEVGGTRVLKFGFDESAQRGSDLLQVHLDDSLIGERAVAEGAQGGTFQYFLGETGGFEFHLMTRRLMKNMPEEFVADVWVVDTRRGRIASIVDFECAKSER